MFQLLWFLAFILVEILAVDRPGYIEAAGTGCKVWSASPEGPGRVTWSGACVSGLADGPGVAEWLVDGNVIARIEGRLRAGKADGFAIVTWREGDRYEGEWRDGLWHGQGLYLAADASVFEGEWRGSRRNGRGLQILPTGARYEGEWRNDLRDGRGVYTWPSGARYDGEWRGGRQQGHGVHVYRNKARYEGEFHQGKRDGKGTLYFASGWYWGEWCNDRPEGRGTAVIDGIVHTGTWRHGCRQEHGGHAVWVATTKAACGFT